MTRLTRPEQERLRRETEASNRRVRQATQRGRRTAETEDELRTGLSGARPAPGAAQTVEAVRSGEMKPYEAMGRDTAPSARRQVRQDAVRQREEEARRALAPPLSPDEMAAIQAGANERAQALAEGREVEGGGTVIGDDTEGLPSDPELRRIEVDRRRREAGLDMRDEVMTQRAKAADMRRNRSRFLKEQGRGNPAMQRRVQELEQGRAEVLNNPAFDEQEREVALGEIDRQLSSLADALGFADDPDAGREPTLQEQLEQETVELPDGTRIGRDRHGEWKTIYNPPKGAGDAAPQPPSGWREMVRDDRVHRSIWDRAMQNVQRRLEAAYDPESDAAPPSPTTDDIRAEYEKLAQLEWELRYGGDGGQPQQPGTENPWPVPEDEALDSNARTQRIIDRTLELERDGPTSTSWSEVVWESDDRRRKVTLGYVHTAADRLGAKYGDDGRPVFRVNPNNGSVILFVEGRDGKGKWVDVYGFEVKAQADKGDGKQPKGRDSNVWN